MRRTIAAAIFVAGMAGLGACASADTGAQAHLPLTSAPAAPGFPDLRSVPQGHLANTDQRHWTAVENDVLAAANAMQANPRAQYVPPEDPSIFLEQARQDLTQTRDSH